MAQIPNGEFKFPNLSSVVFGTDSVQRLGEKVDGFGAQRALVVANPSLVNKTDLFERVKRALGDKYAGVFSGVKPHTPRESIFEAARLARQVDADIVVSLGGGSAHVTGKGINLVLTVGEEIDDFKVRFDGRKVTVPPFADPKLAQIAIPTTLSAAEFTTSAGLTDTRRNHKDSFRHPLLRPKVIILDPKMTVYTPKELWGSSGLKSLADCFGQFCSPKHIPFVDALVLHAIWLMDRYLIRSIAEPLDLEARSMMWHAAWLSHYGVGYIGGTGLNAGLRHQIGPMHNVEHGVASAIVFPHCLNFNRPDIDERLAMIAETIGLSTGKRDDLPAVAIDRVKELIGAVGLPTRLRDIGIPRAALRATAESVMQDRALASNPKPINSVEDVLGVLEAAW